jgi:hypothetical protein
MCKRYNEYIFPMGARIAVGTYNVNGGKHFRSVVYKDLSLSDWLLDASHIARSQCEYLPITCITGHVTRMPVHCHSWQVRRSCLTKITSQLPLFATYLVFTVHNIISHYMFRLYGHLQVCYIYRNAKIILKLNGAVNLVSK